MGCTRLTRRILQKHPRQDLVNILQELSENSRPVEERLSEIKELLQQHPDIVKYCGSQKYPAMHTAAINDESQVMELLIQHDADIEAKDATDHRTPLFFTITKQSIRCFQLLLEKGANVNAVGRDGKSVLHVAVEHNVKHGKMVRELIRRGASLKYTIVKSGYTPIHTAACIGDYELLKMFLKHDRNAANFCDRKGNVPLHLSAEKGHKYSCNILLQYGANIDVNNKMKETPLHLAVKGSFISTCEELLISHCNINSEDKDGNTALLSSTASNKRCSKDILELLLQHKADIYVKRPNGDSALHLAAKAGYPDKCLLLVQAGADCNLQNVNGMTPLHYATKKGFTECSAVILNLPLNGDSNQYFIPVNVLCEEEEEEDEGKEKDVVCGGRAQCTVFHSSVDVNVKDNDGKMPIHYAVEKGSKECVMQLLKRKANIVIATPDGDTPLHLAARAGLDECCKCFIKRRAAVNAVNKQGKTPIHLAVESNSVACCQVLVKGGANINHADCDKLTPLHIAVKIGATGCCEFLIKKNANLSITEGNEKTPLHWAASEGHLELCEMMINSGKDWQLFKKDNQGMIPLMTAFREKHDEIFCCLLKKMCELCERKSNNKTQSYPKIGSVNDLLATSIREKRPSVIAAIIKSALWEEALAPMHVKERAVNLEQLIRHYPTLAKHVLDKCITRSADSVRFNFYILDDTYYSVQDRDRACSRTLQGHNGNKEPGNSSRGNLSARIPYSEDGTLKQDAVEKISDVQEWRRSRPLNVMVECQRLELLKHDLCQRLMKETWNRYVGCFFKLLLLIEALYVLMLSFYVNLAYDWSYVRAEFNVTQEMACDSSSERDTCERPDSNSSDPNYQCEASSDFRIPGGMLEENFTHVLLRKFTLLLLLVCFAVKRGKNLHCRGMYLRVEKILRLLCFTTTLTLLVDWTDCTAATGVREDWQWRCGVCSVLLAWYHFIILLGLLPQFSVYLFIVNDFLKTILKLFGLLLLQVVAFTFAFQMLMRGKYAFSKFSRAIMKILTMMVGDLGYEENFGNTESLPYPIMSSLLLLCFLGIMVIGMINIVTNLPQGEMEKAKDQAQLINLSVRVSLIITIESWFPSLRKRYNIGWVIDKVNQDISQDTELNSNATINKSCSNLNSSCHLCGGRDPEHTYRLLENLSRQVNEQKMLLQDLMSCVVRGEKHRIKCNTT